MRSNPIAIEIGSVLGEQESPAEFRDLKQVEPLPASASPEASRLGLPAGIAAAIGALAVAVWLSTRRRPPPQYDRWALEQIESIQAEYDQRSIDIGQAYAQLSNVIRAYLEAELAIPATTQSTAELFDELPAEHCPDAARQRLQQFMTAADELKFSGSLAVANNNGVDELFESLRAVVRDTSALAAGQSAVDGEAR